MRGAQHTHIQPPHKRTHISTMGADDDDSAGEEETAPVVCAIAKPLADSKLTKKILKVVKKGAALAAFANGLHQANFSLDQLRKRLLTAPAPPPPRYVSLEG